MSIGFSLSHLRIPAKDEVKTKLYPRAQSDETISLDELSRYAISHYGKIYTPDIVKGVVSVLHQAVMDNLREGKRVSLGEMGTFSYHIESDGITQEEWNERGFRPSTDIKDVTVKWNPSPEMKSLKDEEHLLSFKERSTLKNRKKCLDAINDPSGIVQLK